MTERRGYRGYIGSRPYMGDRAPQHVQNLVIRDYCQRNGMTYLLSATEYAMDNCYVMLEEVLREIDAIEGVAMYSIFMLPESHKRRDQVLGRILGAGASAHFALENLSVTSDTDAQKADDILKINRLMQTAPARDRTAIDLSKS
jgi:sporadic carbohydrate cluster protein (TIGR04323 family)